MQHLTKIFSDCIKEVNTMATDQSGVLGSVNKIITLTGDYAKAMVGVTSEIAAETVDAPKKSAASDALTTLLELPGNILGMFLPKKKDVPTPVRQEPIDRILASQRACLARSCFLDNSSIVRLAGLSGVSALGIALYANNGLINIIT